MSAYVKPIQISSAITIFLGIGSTLIRLYLRRRRIWWDDAAALMSALCLIVQTAACFIHTIPQVHASHHTRIVEYYLLPTSFYGVIWFARISIIFSVMRIYPYQAQKKYLLAVAILFAITGLVMEAQLFWVCIPNKSWQALADPQCPLGTEVAVLQLVTDIISDILLITLPLKLFQDIHEKFLRRRLILIFSTALATSIVSLPHAALILTNAGPRVLIAAVAETCVSLVVCNLPVCVAATMKQKVQEFDGSAMVFADSNGSKPRNSKRSGGNKSSTFGGQSSLFNDTVLSRISESSRVSERDIELAEPHDQKPLAKPGKTDHDPTIPIVL